VAFFRRCLRAAFRLSSPLFAPPPYFRLPPLSFSFVFAADSCVATQITAISPLSFALMPLFAAAASRRCHAYGLSPAAALPMPPAQRFIAVFLSAL